MSGAELAGTVTFAISGVLAVSSSRLDWLGAVVVGVVTALGGGTIRDLLFGDTPVFWLNDLGFLLAATLGAVAAIPLAHRLATGPVRRFDEALQLADAAGLALFVVLGAEVALELSFGPAAAVVAGIITGVGGGVIRDLLADRTPLILSGEIYATAAIAGALVFVVLGELAVSDPLPALAGALVVFGLRVAGIRRQWSLPRLRAAD